MSKLDDHALRVAHRVGNSVGVIPELISVILPTVLPILFQVLAKCFNQNPPAPTPQAYLRANLNADGDFDPPFLRKHRPQTIRSIKIANRGKKPKDRIRLNSINPDEVTRQSFLHILEQSPSAAKAGYVAALAASQSLPDEDEE